MKKSKNLAIRISYISIVINVILSIIKLVVGLILGSYALISDAIHSASDVFTTVIVIIGISISSKESDEQHQYGHERIESIVSLILAGILFVIGWDIGVNGVLSIINGTYSRFNFSVKYGVLTAILSIVTKEIMYQYTKRVAIKVGSDSLMADAWHHRSDSFSSIGSLIGLIGVQMGYPVLDSVASIVICIFIIKVAVQIFLDGCSRLIDRSCDKQTLDKIREIVSQQDGVLRIDMIKTRLFGSKLYIDIEISVNSAMPLGEAHSISEKVHDAVEANITNTKHCMVHVNPF